ncbi:MAG TPA: fibronectin type III domain-containing protein [Verrucomicrobiae bacterium]|nr:fibronectin type III domain-containing protein [Verrucomicrobiae bacterium]
MKATAVRLAWDPTPDADAASGKVSGYKLYYALQDFTQVAPIGASILAISTGTNTSATVPSLMSGLTYYFSVVAVDEKGLESDFSGVAAYTIPADTSANDNTPGPTQINLIGMLPRLWLYPANGQSLLAIQGSIGATFAIQSSTNPTAPDSWITLTNITLSALSPNANPSPGTTLEKAFLPALETFLDPYPSDGELRAYRIYMPLTYPILADRALTAQGLHTHLCMVSFPDAGEYIVCYVEEEAAYLDYNSGNRTMKLEPCGPTIREIADKVAAKMEKTWTSASEFAVAEDGAKILLDTVVPLVIDPPPTDPLPTDPLPTDPLIPPNDIPIDV